MIEHTKKPPVFADASAAMESSDLSLVRRFREVPHPCSDPKCPGNVNRRKLKSREALLATMREIAKGKGAYSRDPLTHAGNTIESMKTMATDAVAEADELGH